MTKTIECCGECSHMKYESMDGYGYCDISEREVFCGDACYMINHDITDKQAAKLLHHYQKYRRGGGELLPPKVYGKAIDAAIKTLREKLKQSELPTS